MSATPTAKTYVHQSTFPTERLLSGIMIIASGLAIATLAVSLYFAWTWLSHPFLGVMLNQTATVTTATSNSNVEWTGLAAGLEPGDHITEINNQPFTSAQEYMEIIGELEPGTPIKMGFERPVDRGSLPETEGAVICGEAVNGFALCTVEYALMSLSQGDTLAYFITPLISSIIVLIIGLAIIRTQQYSIPITLATIMCMLLSIFMITIFDNGTTQRLTPIWFTSGILLGGVLVTFGMLFPTPINYLDRAPWLSYVPIIISIVLVGVALNAYNNQTATNPGGTNQLSGMSILVGVGIMATLMFFYQRPQAITERQRRQANTVFLGFILSMAPGILWLVSQILQVVVDENLLPFPIEITMPFLIVPAFATFFAISQNYKFDSDKAISHGLTYSVMLLALIVSYFLMVIGASLLAIEAIDVDSPLLIVITIFFISILFVPVRTRLQTRIDRLYFRTRHDYQSKVEDFSQHLTSTIGIDEMLHDFQLLLNETIQPTNTFVFLYDRQRDEYIAYGEDESDTDITFEQDSGVIQLLQNSDTMVYLQPNTPWPSELYIDRPRLDILKVMVLAGMPGSERLNGFVCIAPPKSGQNAYNFEELRFLNNLISQMAISVERSQVIGSLEKRVSELNVLSYVGQAVNFTIEVDDLLELISSQTVRLFASPFFYIALMEQVTKQLYFAFFLENDIRDQEKENRRWPLGEDLFSEVIDRQQLRYVEDYVRTMEQKQYPITFENSKTKAWMGVPLIVGTNILGVMAIGESDPNKKYTPEQQKIFSDIGALAATSIEKANLFTEANTRANQLGALNNISRQLVASEGDIERLLDLITTSAVNILNAEAGSLLLTKDSGNGDLEFRSAVGSTGQKLIGTSLPKGHGLVGQVAETGEAVIVNDASADERWKGDVVEGFSTDSIIAVPLIAKGLVVGVLEVINRKDGTLFGNDDTNLLTAFAGQAAIALENARLREQTGIQLNQRLEELEALERIDRQLNQTLDLYKVADITVRAALDKSNAIAGILGVINDNHTALRIVSKSGYTDDEFPEGADDDMWPLDRGIVKRVMRTRRPDLQPDITIDLDYIPSLHGALSQITVPMSSGNDINAILILETDKEPRLNLLDLDWVQRLAEHASIAIANAQLYAEIMRANETKSEFVGFAAHELKNPLTSIKGWAAALGGNMIERMGPEQIRDTAKIIQTNADRMQSIIDDLRDIAADDAGKLAIDAEPINIYTVVIDTLMPYQKQFDEKGQMVINNVADNMPLIYGDHKRLIQVMTNFVSNAHKYSPEGANVTITATVKQRHITSKGRQIGPVMQISITDTGIGLSKEDLSRIFKEDYFRSDNELAQQQKGTGLGMMITKRIIEGHHGEVWVESELGQGSTFAFVIPIVTEDETSNKPQREPASD